MTAADGRYVTLASAAGWLGRAATLGSTDRDDVVISDLLAACEHEIDRVCATVFAPRHVDALEVPYRGKSAIMPIPYAQSVASVTLDGKAVAGWRTGGITDTSKTDPGFARLVRSDTRERWAQGLYQLDGMFGWAEPPEEIKQAVKELVEFRYNTRQGIANITGFGEIVMDGGKPYPASVYSTLRAHKSIASLVSVG